MEIKVTFLLLCAHPPDHLLPELFKIISNSRTKHITKLHFESLLNIMARILIYIGESEAYGGHNIPLIMEQCFTKVHQILIFGIIQDDDNECYLLLIGSFKSWPELCSI